MFHAIYRLTEMTLLLMVTMTTVEMASLATYIVKTELGIKMSVMAS
jgi:hypothetical protein